MNAPPPTYSDVSQDNAFSNSTGLDPNEKVKLYDNKAKISGSYQTRKDTK